MEHLRLWWILAGGIVLALVFFATDHMWRATGSLVATLLVCAVLRVVSPPEVAGGLVVRRPWIDVASLALLAVALGGESRVGGRDALLGEVVQLQTVDDRPLAVGDGAREGRDESLLDAVGAVGGDGHRDDAAVGAEHPVAHVVDRRVGRGGRRGQATRLDDRAAAGGDGRDVGAGDPLLVDELGRDLTVDAGVEEVGVHRVVVVAPDGQAVDGGDRDLELLGEHREGAVVVEAGQGVETLLGDVGSIVHRDEGVGVGRVSGDEDLDVVGGDLVEGGTLAGEDLAVGGEQVGAVHALLARHRPDEHGGIDALENGLGVVADDDIGQRRKGAVVELHHDTLEGAEGRGDLEQAQLDGCVRTQQGTARDAEEEAVADLASGSCDSDLHGCGAHGKTLRSRCGSFSVSDVSSVAWRAHRRGVTASREVTPRVFVVLLLAAA